MQPKWNVMWTCFPGGLKSHPGFSSFRLPYQRTLTTFSAHSRILNRLKFYNLLFTAGTNFNQKSFFNQKVVYSIKIFNSKFALKHFTNCISNYLRKWFCKNCSVLALLHRISKIITSLNFFQFNNIKTRRLITMNTRILESFCGIKRCENY